MCQYLVAPHVSIIWRHLSLFGGTTCQRLVVPLVSIWWRHISILKSVKSLLHQMSCHLPRHITCHNLSHYDRLMGLYMKFICTYDYM